MKRRDFLKSVSGLAAGAMVPAPAILVRRQGGCPLGALLIVSEGGPTISTFTASAPTSRYECRGIATTA